MRGKSQEIWLKPSAPLTAVVLVNE